MAGHSKFKNIQHRKGAQDKKRAKNFTKVVKEIIVAVRTGSADVANNPRLKQAINNAKSFNLPKDRIERAIAQASNPYDGENYHEIRFEGFLSGGVAIIVEALTDNNNRTVAEVRSVFNKAGGRLAEKGSVSFMFTHAGVIKYSKQGEARENLLELGLELGAYDISDGQEDQIIYTSILDFHHILEYLNEKFGIPKESYIGWIPQSSVEPESSEQFEKINKVIDVLEENNDVQRVFSNLKNEIC